jgi:hypothetical protein
MADQQRRHDVLQRADDDEDLSEPARLVLRAAWGDPSTDDLTEAMNRLDATVAGLARQRARALTTPDLDEVKRACAALRAAATEQASAERVADALSADRTQFLETSLEFHDRHGTQPCPVCAEGTLDEQWVVRARAALTAEKDAASALRVARSGAHRARQALTALVRAVDAPPAEDAGLTTAVAARVAHQSFSTLPTDGDVALADHVARTVPDVRVAYAALREEAAGATGAPNRDAPTLESAREAQQWLRAFASS